MSPDETNGRLGIADGLVVVIAGTSWDGIWMPERHVAMNLAERHPVLWVDPKISRLSPMHNPVAIEALNEPRLRWVAPNIIRLTPITVPGVSRPFMRDVAVWQARRAVRRAVAATGARVHSTLVSSPNDMLNVVPSAQRVFYGTDDYVAGARLTGMNARWLQRCTERQLRRADLVLATSPALQDKWSIYRQDIKMIPNGCDAEHFATADLAPPPQDVHLPGPVAGFVGHMSERMDLAMLEAVASSGVSLLLVGPRQPTFEIAKLDRLFAMPNVQWVGAKDFQELPSYLRIIDVGLTPYTQSDFNRASFPLKTLEYLAAGRPAVVSDLPAHRWLDTPHVSIARTPREFADQTRLLLGAPQSEQEVRTRQAFGARHSWAARSEEIRQVLGLRTEESAPASGRKVVTAAEEPTEPERSLHIAL